MIDTPSSIKAVLFDLDGTLIDTYDLILTSMDYTTKAVLGKEFSADCLMKKVGQPLETQFWEYTDSEEVHTTLLKVYREHNARLHDEMVSPFEGVSAALKTLCDAGYPLGVVTSKRHEPALHGLRLFELDSYFDCLVGSDDCATHKPDPGPVIHGAHLLGLDPRDCLFVGDSPFDVQAGKGAGASTVAALWGMFPEDVLRAEAPQYVCGNLQDVSALLGV